ncbi:hypothetical protein NTH_03978 [Nitratireductor thuwali]|uniref:Integrase n=1 Tax=Nitratireductor thuwali TaxID=2267699 RepID=A0ABY5MNB2_9HYPH|nr:hypothetical protein NTH_03978 [Nitratireductor thuwali]
MAGQGKPSKAEGFTTVADIGLTHKDVHEARLIRDAEIADPGITRRTLDECIEAKQEPTKVRASQARQALDQLYLMFTTTY